MALMSLKILYRGPLSSCNYDCHYCPFAKRHETAAELRSDRQALSRFVEWAATQSQFELSLLFTPWGEALVRPWYQEALARLSHVESVRLVAIQTNLSCRLDWLASCDNQKLALWCTYHPTQIARSDFLAQCDRLQAAGVRYSVGVVGLREAFDEIEALRRELSAEVYLWINAYKDEPGYYTRAEIGRLSKVDPLVCLNLPRYRSLGEDCRAGQSAISVDGYGNIRRCHFVREIIGNLHEPGWEAALLPRACPNATCGCYIGYIHMPRLEHDELFGAQLLARVPSNIGAAAQIAADIIAAESPIAPLIEQPVTEAPS